MNILEVMDVPVRRSVLGAVLVVACALASDVGAQQRLLTLDDIYDPQRQTNFTGNVSSRRLWMDATRFAALGGQGGEWVAVDAASGKTLWSSDPGQGANAAIVKAGNLLFSLEDDGELVVFRHNRAAFEVLKRYKVADTETWVQPTISGDRIFVKAGGAAATPDGSTLALWTLN